MDLFLCPNCGNILEGETCAHCDDRLIYRILQREAWLLLLLALLAIPSFFLTRALAVKMRTVQTEGAAMWYARGEARLQAGDNRGAVERFRQAVAADQRNMTYSLALAGALAGEGRNDEAQRLLLQLREDQPENARINLQLGRLTARQGNVKQAVLHYRHALYGRWPAGEPDSGRLDVRRELIRLLLLHRDFSAAASEILILVKEIPETPEEQTDVGRLFLAAGEPGQALKLFQSALKQKRDAASALAGAGEAHFMLGEYAAARRYLRRLPSQPEPSERVRRMRNVSELVLARDPLLPRLTELQRSQRLRGAFSAAQDHLEACSARTPRAEELRAEGDALRSRLQGSGPVQDPALLDATLDWVHRTEDAVGRACGTSDLQQALLLISRPAAGRSGE